MQIGEDGKRQRGRKKRDGGKLEKGERKRKDRRRRGWMDEAVRVGREVSPLG